MKNKYIYSLYSLFGMIFSLAFMLASCSMEDDHGYPKVVEMPAEGGTLRISGESSPYAILIVNKKGDGFRSPNEGDTLVASYDWLTVKHKKYDYRIMVTAEPNISGKKRKLLVLTRFVGNTYAEIEVVQKK